MYKYIDLANTVQECTPRDIFTHIHIYTPHSPSGCYNITQNVIKNVKSEQIYYRSRTLGL